MGGDQICGLVSHLSLVFGAQKREHFRNPHIADLDAYRRHAGDTRRHG